MNPDPGILHRRRLSIPKAEVSPRSEAPRMQTTGCFRVHGQAEPGRVIPATRRRIPLADALGEDDAASLSVGGRLGEHPTTLPVVYVNLIAFTRPESGELAVA
jgi:hypothetical protein